MLSYIKVTKGLQFEARFANTSIIHLIYNSTVRGCIIGNVGIRFTRDKNAHPKKNKVHLNLLEEYF